MSLSGVSPFLVLKAVASLAFPCSSRARLLCAVLGKHADKNGKCWPSIERLSRCSGLHRSTVIRGLRELEEAGILEAKRRTGAHSWYRLSCKALEALAGNEASTSSTEQPVPQSNRFHSETAPVPPCDRTGSTVEPEVFQELSKKKTRKKRGSLSGPPPTDFEAWFRGYAEFTGRHRTKKEASQQWGRLSGDLRRDLPRLTAEWSANRETARGAGIFVPEAPDPVRFLRHHRWEDRIEIQAPGAAPGDDILDATRRQVAEELAAEAER